MNYLEILTKAQKTRAIEYYSAEVNVQPLAAAATADPTFTVGDADFLITDITGVARDPANPTVVFLGPAITIQINDEGSGRNLFNRPHDWFARIGVATDPYMLPWPFMVKQTSTVTVSFASIAGAGGQAYNAQVCLGGFKIFPRSKSVDDG